MTDVRETALSEVRVIEPRIYRDDRGAFFEAWHEQRYAAFGINESFVQDNISRSGSGVLRGLHFQHPNGQGKLVQVLEGEVFDVAVDVRAGSPTFGQWVGVTLSSENGLQCWIPQGFAHGFCVTSERAVFAYKCTAYYDPGSEHTLRWNDPDVGIDWPVAKPDLSAKDRDGALLKDLTADQLPAYSG